MCNVSQTDTTRWSVYAYSEILWIKNKLLAGYTSSPFGTLVEQDWFLQYSSDQYFTFISFKVHSNEAKVKQSCSCNCPSCSFSTRIPGCDSHSSTLLDFFLLSDASISSTMTFPPLGNSGHVVVSVFIDFPADSKTDAPFPCTAYNYSRADGNDLRDHLRDVLWEDIFNLHASVAAAEYCEWVQVRVDLYILDCKYQF